jgi:hypothetical protein
VSDLTRTHLFGERAPAKIVGSVALVGFAEQRVEGFCGAMSGRRVRADRVRSHVAHLFRRVHLAGRPVQQVGVLEILRDSLQNRQRLVEIDLNTVGGEIAHKTFELTGMGILESSFPMQLRMIDQRLRPTCGRGMISARRRRRDNDRRFFSGVGGCVPYNYKSEHTIVMIGKRTE